MAAKSQSAVKTFSLHWGSGVIEEEAQFATPVCAVKRKDRQPTAPSHVPNFGMRTSRHSDF